jgi:hypothetical protein
LHVSEGSIRWRIESGTVPLAAPYRGGPGIQTRGRKAMAQISIYASRFAELDLRGRIVGQLDFGGPFTADAPRGSGL